MFAFVEIEKAGSRAREQSAAALEAAHKEVRNTYTAIGGMSQRMIANVQALLDLQDNLQARIQEAQTLHQTVTRQIKDVETQRDQLTSDLSTHRAQLRQTRKELSETQGERDKARSEQSKRLDEYHRLRQELAQLADKVLDQREEALDTETLRAEIARIDREYISDPSAWLRAFAKDPGEATGRTLTRLEGLRYDALETAIRSTAGDFRIWIKATIGDTMNF
ncbi:MAG: hypothetical protein U9Q81_11860, partial [Pseudomonadota bacterium]|nr:hypothetical protein [Pseudomonadota bacterium]